MHARQAASRSTATKIEVLNSAAEVLPFTSTSRLDDISPDIAINHRPLALRTIAAARFFASRPRWPRSSARRLRRRSSRKSSPRRSSPARPRAAPTSSRSSISIARRSSRRVRSSTGARRRRNGTVFETGHVYRDRAARLVAAFVRVPLARILEMVIHRRPRGHHQSGTAETLTEMFARFASASQARSRSSTHISPHSRRRQFGPSTSASIVCAQRTDAAISSMTSIRWRSVSSAKSRRKNRHSRSIRD